MSPSRRSTASKAGTCPQAETQISIKEPSPQHIQSISDKFRSFQAALGREQCRLLCLGCPVVTQVPEEQRVPWHTLTLELSPWKYTSELSVCPLVLPGAPYRLSSMSSIRLLFRGVGDDAGPGHS